MLRRSASCGDLAFPSIHTPFRHELIVPSVLPSSVYKNLVRDAFEPARQAKRFHSKSYTDLRLAWRCYPGQPRGSFALNYLAEPGWRDRFDRTLRSAERVMDDVHGSLFPTKHYINVGEWAYFDWNKAKVVEPMRRPYHRSYTPAAYSRCWDTSKHWNNTYGRTFSQAAYDRWSRFAGNRVLGGSWQWPTFWMHRFSQEGIFTPYYKSPWYITPEHRYYDYVQW